MTEEKQSYKNTRILINLIFSVAVVILLFWLVLRELNYTNITHLRIIWSFGMIIAILSLICLYLDKIIEGGDVK